MLGHERRLTTWRRNYYEQDRSGRRRGAHVRRLQSFRRRRVRLCGIDELNHQMLGIQQLRPTWKRNRRQFLHSRLRNGDNFRRDPRLHRTTPHLRDRFLSGEMLGAQLRLPALKLQRSRHVLAGIRHWIVSGSNGYFRLSRAYVRSRKRRSEMLGKQFLLPALRRHYDGEKRSGGFGRTDLGSRVRKRGGGHLVRSYHVRLSQVLGKSVCRKRHYGKPGESRRRYRNDLVSRENQRWRQRTQLSAYHLLSRLLLGVQRMRMT